MARCAFKHDVFKQYNSENAFLVDGDQCWVEETRPFDVKGKEVTYCIFHAPPNLADMHSVWPPHQRNAEQTTELSRLIYECSRQRSNPNTALNFVLPGLHCRNLTVDLGNRPVRGLVLPDAVFEGNVHLSRPNCHINFSGSTFNSLVIDHTGTIPNANFEGVSINSGSISAIRMENSNFSNAKIVNFKFEGTIFQGSVNFIGCAFEKAELGGTFENADFSGAAFRENTKIENANFVSPNFSGATFDKFEIRGGAKFSDANFGKAKLSNGTIVAANFINARFFNAKFSNLKVDGTVFQQGTSFSRCTFEDLESRAEFQNTDFSQAKFRRSLSLQKSNFAEPKFAGAKFYADVNFGPGTISGHADFSRATFKGRASFKHLDCKLANFEKATFFKEANFSISNIHTGHFLETIFKEEAVFYGATIQEVANFNKAKFRGLTIFLEANIKTAQFRNSRFRRGIFTRATFESADFQSARFFAGVLLDGAKFGLAPVISNVVCKGQAIFNSAVFESGVQITDSRFEKLECKNVNLKRPSSLSNCKIDTLVYTTHAGERLSINHCRQKKNSKGIWDFENQDCSELAFLHQDLSRASFLGADVNRTLFDACTWIKGPSDKYIRVFRHDQIVRKNDKAQMELLQSLYRQLKKNQEESRNYIDAGDFHFREKDIRQRRIKELTGKGIFTERWILRFYRCIADFGENFRKLAGWMFLSLAGTAAGVSMIEEFWGQNGGELQWCARYRVDCILDPIESYFDGLGMVFFGAIPSAFQRQIFVENTPHWLSRVLIVGLGLWLLLLAALLIMAVRRRFRH